jgi:adenylate kinase
MEQGKLVADELLYEIVADRLKQADCARGFILDGFPRTAAQAGWLDAYLAQEFFEKSKKCSPVVIRMDVDYTQLLLRISGRRSCPTCGRIYNLHFQPPGIDELCDQDGSKLIQRNDDREEVIRPRLEAYEIQTRPVADYYQSKGRLIALNADRPIEEVSAEIFDVIDRHPARQFASGPAKPE